MHYHIAANPNYHGTRFPDWYTGKYLAVLPEVTGQKLAASTLQCVMTGALVVAKPSGGNSLEVMVNNNGRRREFTPRQLVDFLTTCKKNGNSVSIEPALVSTLTGWEIERRLVQLFGKDGYLVTSGRAPDRDYLLKFLPVRMLMQKAPVAQQLSRR